MDGLDLRVWVDGLPVAQPRPRITMAHRYAHAYTPAKHPVTQFREDVKWAVQHAYHGDCIDAAFALDCEFCFPRPKNKIWKTRSMPREYKLSKPDLDNLLKPIKDVLSGIVWTDDSRVVIVRGTKVICAGTRLNGAYKQEPVGCEIRIRLLTTTIV